MITNKVTQIYEDTLKNTHARARGKEISGYALFKIQSTRSTAEYFSHIFITFFSENSTTSTKQESKENSGKLFSL